MYAISQNTDASVLLYRDFLGKLPDLVLKDKSLVDQKILEDTEQRISQLEKEKELKDELIRKKNVFNYGLIGALIVLTALIIFIFRTLKKVQTKNKKIALQSLRREMNPHFIFNSLNSVNHFIATNNEMEANQYLTKFFKAHARRYGKFYGRFYSVSAGVGFVTKLSGFRKNTFCR
ncbi:histidine kinase [Chryseobacterium wanjuense]